MFDSLIVNGWIADGTGNPWFQGHVGITEGRITFVMRGASCPEAERVIDAAGVTPPAA